MTATTFKEQLLPESPTKLDLAQELTDAARFPLDTEAVRRTKDPLRADEVFLPLLGWERSVDVWRNDWSISKKRYVCDIAYELTRLKGTREGLKRFIEIADAECLLIEAPPLMFFPGREMTQAERLAWLARFEQLRTYKYATTGNDAFAMFLTSEAIRPFCLSNSVNRMWCARTIDGLEYWKYQTKLWDRGAETPLTTWSRAVIEKDKTVNVYDQHVLPGKLNDAWFLDSDPKIAADGEIGFFPTSLDPVAERTVSGLADRKSYGDHDEEFASATVSPGLQPIYIKPERVAENAPVKAGDWFLDHQKAYNFPCSFDRAALHIYDRLYLYEKHRGDVPMPPTARAFLDHTYFQFPAFTARAYVGITGHLPKQAFMRYVGGYLVEPDLSTLWECVEAVRASKSARDLIQIDTQAHDVVTTSPVTMCGTAACGAQVRL